MEGKKILVFITSVLFFLISSAQSTDVFTDKTNNKNDIKDIHQNILAFTDQMNKRIYPDGRYTAHTVGYISNKSSGVGLEKKYKHYLKGENTLITTLDINLLKSLSDLFDGYNGSLIVMNANTGAITAANSFPNYDANIFINGMSRKNYNVLVKDTRKPFVNKFINDLYEPSSLIAPAVALSFFELGVDVDTKEYCHHDLLIGAHLFKASSKDTTTRVDLQTALEKNCIYYFYNYALMMGNEKLAKSLHKFGFGEQTGVDLPNEFYGLVGTKEWKEKRYNTPWYIGNSLRNAIGKDYILVTPIQITRYMASLITGNLVTPHFRKNIEIKKRSIGYSKKTLQFIHNAMYNSFNKEDGLNKELLPENMHIAGITNDSKQYISFYIPNANTHYVITLFLKDKKVTSKMITDIVSVLKKYNYTR